MNTKDKSLGYTLFVDEEMDGLFHMFYALFDSFDEFTRITGKEILGFKQNEMNQMKEAFVRFLKATDEPSHELGWCKDPTCEWVPKEKKK